MSAIWSFLGTATRILGVWTLVSIAATALFVAWRQATVRAAAVRVRQAETRRGLAAR